MRTISFLFLLFFTSYLHAHTFQAYNEEGKMIYYNKISDTECEVTYESAGNRHYFSYSGDVKIPSSVYYNDTELFVTSIGVEAFYQCDKLQSVVLSEGIRTINNYAFNSCKNLSLVQLPNTLNSIGQSVFYGCDKLTSLELPNSLESLAPGAFSNCKYINEIILPNSLKSIGGNAFQNCWNLKQIVIPESVCEIGNGIFSGCVSLESVKVAPSNPIYDSRNDCNGIIKTEDNSLVSCCLFTTIPNSVTKIGDGAFQGFSSLKDVTIPNSVTSIGSYAFYGCSNLEMITIPNRVKSIGDHAFYGCSSLTFLDFPNSVIEIGESICNGCTNLEYVELSNSLQKIPYNAFWGCNELTEVTFPNSITEIEEGAFYGCKSIHTLKFGRFIDTLGQKSFAGTYGLKEVYCYSLSVPKVEEEAFAWINLKNVTLFVPSSAYDNYLKEEPWKNFGQILKFEADNTLICESPIIKYENGKLLVSSNTDDAIITTSITCDDVKSTTLKEIDLTASYTITAYAKKTGYLDSTPTIAHLIWVKGNIDSGIPSSIDELLIPATPVLINCTNGYIYVSGVEENTEIKLFTVEGRLLDSTRVNNSTATLNSYSPNNRVVILRIGENSYKIYTK